MKALVLLAVLGAVSAQYQVYTGLTPYSGLLPYNYPGLHPLPYAGHPINYPLTYTYPYVGNLPLSFKPEEKKAAEDKPVVEAREKRSVDEDQKAEDATLIYNYATNTYPLTYNGFPYTTYTPSIYRSIYNPVAYSGLYSSLYHGYRTPLVHSLKKRDTAAAEADQDADAATYITSYAGYPYPLTYAGWPYQVPIAKNVYKTPASTAPLPLTYTGLPYTYPYYG